MEAVAEKKLTRGGEFLVRSSNSADIFIPEEWSEEQINIAKMCSDFLAANVHPILDRIDSMKEPGLMPELLDKVGEQGMLGISLPEEYGGFGLDTNTGMLSAEILGRGHSFSVALTAHTGIGTLPILYFGNPEQKAKYLPKLATGEWKASYCLTEPGSGSDALGAKTRADLTEDGQHYILNGQKMWITNAGFANVFIVFAKIDGKHFTGFIVDGDTPGITLNEEEKKMGIKGSSTRQVFFSDVKVPVGNVLGDIGKGHLIAFNILNIGRIKLGAATLGAAKAISHLSVTYANERHQFQRPIASFGAIQHKLAEQAIRIWATEAAIYRSSDAIQQTEHRLLAEGKPFNDALLGAAQEYAAECAILKVLGSETLDYVIDEGVQIYGGYGFSADFPMDRAYRDSRINRIFEGTNEINRMLTVDYIFKKAMKGELDLMTPAMALEKELKADAPVELDANDPLAASKLYVSNLKKATIMVAGKAAMKFMQKLAEEQEVLMNAADMIIQVYTAESALLRAEKLVAQRGAEAIATQIDMVNAYVLDAADRVYLSGKTALTAFSEGQELSLLLSGLRKLTRTEPQNTVAMRRRIAAKLIEANTYPFGLIA